MTSTTASPRRSALHPSTAAKSGSLLIISLSLLILGPACSVDPSYACNSEAVETVSVDNADLGFSAQDVLDVIATGSWDLSWEVDPDFLIPDFDQLNTAMSLGDGDIWHRRMLDLGCYEDEDFLVIPLQSTLVDPGGAFVSGGPDSVYAFGLDLDLITLQMVGPYVEPTVVPAELTEEAEARRAAYGSESVIVSTVFDGRMDGERDPLMFTIDNELSNPAGGGMMAAAMVSPR